MTRKDYILIAECLRVQFHRAALQMASANATVADTARHFQGGVIESAEEIADALERDNLRFDREHFLAVVRGEKDLNSRPARRN